MHGTRHKSRRTVFAAGNADHFGRYDAYARLEFRSRYEQAVPAFPADKVADLVQ